MTICLCRLGLVLDTSDSVKRVLPQEKRAAVDFLDRVMRPQTDIAFVMAFAETYKIVAEAQPPTVSELVECRSIA